MPNSTSTQIEAILAIIEDENSRIGAALDQEYAGEIPRPMKNAFDMAAIDPDESLETAPDRTLSLQAPDHHRSPS